MRKTVFAVLTLASIGYVAAASAQTQTPSPEPAAATTAPPVEEPKICREQDSGGNSRLGTRKVCRTQKEWDALPRGGR
jgi:invasion protein IalB